MIWNNVIQWDFFTKDTIGKQLVKSADSIAANISEGYGRYFYKEHKQFGYYARGSVYETITWITKANNRNIFKSDDYAELQQLLKNLTVKLNNYLKSIGRTPIEEFK